MTHLNPMLSRQAFTQKKRLDHHCLRMMQARKVARDLLAGLESSADADDMVPVGTGRAKFHFVRLLGVQGYLSSKWALADRVARVAGKVLCSPNQLNNEKRPPQLVSHFVQSDLEKTTAAVAFLSLRRSFGWPIGISYAIRNLVFHDGGRSKAADIFDGDTPASAFAISDQGWDFIVTRAKTYGVEPNHHRVGAA